MPVVERVDVSAPTVPTGAPEADGTLRWDRTTLVPAAARSAGATGLGDTCAPAATARVISDPLADTVTGQPALHVPRCDEAMHRAAFPQGGRRQVALDEPTAKGVADGGGSGRLRGEGHLQRGGVPVQRQGGAGGDRAGAFGAWAAGADGQGE